jgi:molybdopterin molybdotransferase
MSATAHDPAARLPVDEALARVIAAMKPLASEKVPLTRALGRVLREPIVAPYVSPPWPNSAMDGYAVRAADVRGATPDAPVTLPVAGTIAAGSQAGAALLPGTAWRVMTGGPIPAGCDSVVRVEDTDGGTESVTITADRDAGRNVRPRGEDFGRGDLLLPAGTLLGAAQVGLLAACGRREVRVGPQPHVAILASGDELVDVDRFDEVLAGSRIVSTNSYTLAAAVVAAGGVPHDLGIVADDPDAMAARLEGALGTGIEVLVTSGGISVGAFDHTKAVLAKLGATLDIWKVRMRPGGPFAFGTVRGIPWFGLPGNPVSALVTCEVFVKPALRALTGDPTPIPVTVPVVLEEAVRTQAPLTHFLRARVVRDDDGTLRASLTGPQGSGLLTSMARADALVIVPDDVRDVAAGSVLDALPLRPIR